MSGAPVGHPGACRQAGDEPDPRGRAAGLSCCLSGVPALPHSPTDLCVPSADRVPGFGVTGPGLGSRARLQVVPETHFPQQPGWPGAQTLSLMRLRSPGLCRMAELGPGNGGGPGWPAGLGLPLSSS